MGRPAAQDGGERAGREGRRRYFPSALPARDVEAASVDVLISEARIQRRVRELGRQIQADYQGKPLTIVAILTGSLILLADLIRRIELPLRVALLQASSY